MHRPPPPASLPDASEQDASSGSRAVHRALEILTHVIEDGPLTLGQLAKASGLPSSTTLRNLRALEHWKYVTRSEESTYGVGALFVESRVSVDLTGSDDLIELSNPILKQLTEATNESSYLSVPGPARTCIYLREIQSDQPIRYIGFSGWAGRAVSTDNSAVGEVFAGRTPEVGYCVKEAALTPEATVIAAPVRDGTGTIIAVLSVAGPTFRMQAPELETYGTLTVAAAADLERLICGTD